MIALLVEEAMDEVRSMMRAQFNANLSLIYTAKGDSTVNLDRVPNNNYYFSEAIEPLRPPAIFIVSDRTGFDLNFQNANVQTHDVLVAALVEDVEQQRLTKKVWRYAAAIHATLHDQGTMNIRVLVTGMDYGATAGMRTTGTGRTFRTSVTVRCKILHAEL